MKPFAFASVTDVDTARATVAADRDAFYIAGGTNLLDLMKDHVEQPRLLVDITALPLHQISANADGIRLGALVTMADAADSAAVRSEFPVVAQALLASASPQLRNMATLGGNVMQRTRCAYFRDVSQPCNKRNPGVGCAAIGGENRRHAVIGTSDHCICTHPSDLAVALLTVDANLHVHGVSGSRSIALERLYVLPGSTPHIEHALDRGDLIESIELPASAHARNSVYLKVRDRASYEFALVAVAVALEMQAGTVKTARVALGGVAPVPWRSREAEALLTGKPATSATYAAAAHAATANMRGYGKNDFKITLTQRAVERALRTAGGIA